MASAVGSAASTRVNADAILDAIADGRTAVEGKRTPWRISFRQAASGVRRRVRYRVQQFRE